MTFKWPEVFQGLKKDNRFALIEAHAGTGKTYTIEHLVLWLALDAGISPELMTLVTFSRPAAYELTQRVQAKAEELYLGEKSKSKKTKLREVLTELQHSNIGTIHSFCLKVLALENEMSSSKVVAEKEFVASQWRSFLRKHAFVDPEMRLIWEWVLQEDSVGKVYDALENLWTQGVRPEGPLSQHRFLCSDAGTFEKNYFEILTNQIAQNVIDGGAGALHKAKAVTKTRELAITEFASFRSAFKKSDSTAAAFLRLHSLKISMLSYLPEDHPLLLLPTPEQAVALGQLHKFGEFLSEAKAEQKIQTYDDMILHVRDALRNNSQLCEAVRAKWPVCILDEFQDTDAGQWEIFQTIYFRDDTNNTRLYAVGDPKQAIYSFRGSDRIVYEHAKKLFAENGIILSLRQNFRSSPEFIEAVNFICSGMFRIQKYSPISSAAKRVSIYQHTPGDTRAWQVFKLSHDKLGDAKLEWQQHLVFQIERLVQSNLLFTPPKGETRPLVCGDFLILVKSWADADSIAELLEKRGLPFQILKAHPKSQSRAWIQTLDFLRAICAPHDKSHISSYLLTPYAQCSPEDLFDYWHNEKDLTCIQSLWAHREQLSEASEISEGAFAETLLQIFNASNARQFIFNSNSKTFAEELLQSWKELHTLALQAGDLESLMSFLDEPNSSAKTSASATETADNENLSGFRGFALPNAIRIQTIHGAKGLESPVVCLGSLAFGQGPQEGLRVFRNAKDERMVTWEAREEPQAQDVERTSNWECLWYVAITRAQGLILCPWFNGAQNPKVATSDYGLIQSQFAELESVQSTLVQFHDSDPGAIHSHTVSLPKGRASVGMKPNKNKNDYTAPTVINAKSWEVAAANSRSPQLTSYSRLKASLAGSYKPQKQSQHVKPGGDVQSHTEPLPNAASWPEELAGKKFGTCFHKAMELISWQEIQNDKLKAIELCADILETSGISVTHAHWLCDLVQKSWETEVLIHSGSTKLKDLKRVWKEADFFALYLGEKSDTYPMLRAKKDRLRGAYDAIFIVDDWLYFLDWKTDNFPDFSSQGLRAAMLHSYGIQIDLYSDVAGSVAQTLSKLLGTNIRPGGGVYVSTRACHAGLASSVSFLIAENSSPVKGAI